MLEMVENETVFSEGFSFSVFVLGKAVLMGEELAPFKSRFHMVISTVCTGGHYILFKGNRFYMCKDILLQILDIAISCLQS